MAIAFRSVGARLKVDLSNTWVPLQNVALPAGHTSGDLLLLFVVTDGNQNTLSDPSGWTRLFGITQGTATATPYTPVSRLRLFYRIDPGTLGSSVALNFDVNDPWPKGKYEVLAFCAAYSGVDPSAPIGEWFWQTTTSTSTAMAHGTVSTSRPNDWLLTFRAIASDSPAATFTNSVGTDAERVDDSDTINELALALYDSNAALAAGAQTQRTTTASRAATYGGVGVTLAIQPPAPVTAAQANAQVASGTATAAGVSPKAVSGPWDLCSTGGLPTYSFAIDWTGDGLYVDSSSTSTTYGTDAFGRTVSGGWGSADTGGAWTVSGGTGTDFSVGSGVGLHAITTRGVNRFSTLPMPGPDMDLRVDVATDQVAAGDSFLLNLSRFQDTSNYYSARLELTATQGVLLTMRKVVGGTDTQLAGPYNTGLTHTAGTFYSMRLRVLGSTLFAKLWATGAAEPDWQLTATDTSLPTAVSAGVRSMARSATTNTLPVNVSFDNFSAVQALNADDITKKIVSDISISYGRDQQRQLNPAAVGSASFSLVNVDRSYSPDVVSSVLYGDLEPARKAQGQVTYGGNVYPLMRSKIDDYNIKADANDRNVDFTFLDGLADLQNVKLSTSVYRAQRTGTLINTILDAAGWTGGRDIDLGATVVPYWWVEGVDALSAITDLVKSEGPPAVAYQDPSGTFVFRDRHHRLLRSQSTTAQAVFAEPTLMDCKTSEADMPVGSYRFTAPFSYAHGWRDIVNSVSFEVSERLESSTPSVVWTSDSTVAVANGQSVTISISTNDPFLEAIVPQSGVDYFTFGPGQISISLSRTSGQSTTMTLLATGGPVSVTNLQLRAKAITVQRTVKVMRQDADSITRHGEKDYPDAAPWANANDADAIAGMILLHYARRRPIVQLRIVSSDPSHFVQALTRTISDRIHIRYDEMGLDDDFFVEKITHTIRRMNQSGQPPVHVVVLGCEKDLKGADNPFTFDKRGAGFDQGVFDYIQTDNASSVFIFDHPTQGQFDVGLYGT